MTAQHTPGPWSIDCDSLIMGGQVVTGQFLGPDTATLAEFRANARLIAASPELLAALKSAAASIQLQAATARHMAEVRDRDANLGLAQELERNAKYYADIIAKAEGRE